MADMWKLINQHGGPEAVAERIGMDELEAGAREHLTGYEHPGHCVACGADRDGCEPDAVGYECDACGEMAVCGDSELWVCLV